MKGNDMAYEDPNFGPEMTRYRALELAIRSGFQDGDPIDADSIVDRARKYAEFMTEQPVSV